MRPAVHFLGQRRDVPEIMRALDLTLLPSWEEPFGLVTVESLALGTPPLVSANGAGPELVADGVTGRLLPPRQPSAWAAAARELLEDRTALRRMAAARAGGRRAVPRRPPRGPDAGRLRARDRRAVARPVPAPMAAPARTEDRAAWRS